MKIFFGTDWKGNEINVEVDLISKGKVDLERDEVIIWIEEMREAAGKIFGSPAVADGVSIGIFDDTHLASVELDNPFADKDLWEDLECVPVEFTPAEYTWLAELREGVL